MSDPNFRDVFRRPHDLRIVWLILPAVLLTGSLSMLPLRSWDYWWHIAFGRMISDTGEMPLFAHFLYTMPADAPSYVQAWLSQWALFELHERFGLNVVLILRNAFGGLAWLGLTVWAARRAGNVAVGSIAALAGAIFGFFCVAARTHLLAWPLFLVVLPVAYAVRHKTLPLPALAIIPLVSVAWTNLHGTFLIPTLISIAFVAAEIGDRVLGKFGWIGREPVESNTPLFAWIGTLLATFGATVLNPRGHEVYLYLIDLPTNPENLQTVTEWFPTTPFFPNFYGAFFWFLFIALAAMMWKQRDRVDLADTFIFLGFSMMAMRHSRALLWVGLSMPVVLSPYLRSLNRFFPTDEEGGSIVNTVMAIVLLTIPFAVQPWSADNPLPGQVQPMPTRTEPPLKGLVLADTPIEAAQRLRAKDASDLRIFHDSRYPGFLLYWLDDEVPDQIVFLDNRVELPAGETWREYDRVSQGKDWREVFDRYDVNAVVASAESQQGLVDAMRGADGWTLDFENEFYVLYVRDE